MPLDALSDGALPDVFLPYQQELWSSVSHYAVTVAEKSRRTGFSWALGAIATSYAGLKKSDGGMDVLYMGYDHEMAREFIDYVATWAKVFQHAASAVEEFVFDDPDHPERNIKAFRIKFDSGFEVIALPSVARALRGKQGLVILDEAAFIDDLEEVLKAAFALLMWGGKVVVVSTHNGDTNPFNVLINDIRAGRKPYHLLRVTLDEALAQGLYKRICFTKGLEWTPEKEATWRQELLEIYGDNADEELHVIPNPSTGSYIPSPLIDARMRPEIPVLRLERDAAFSLWAEPLRATDIDAWMKAELDPILATLDPETPHCFGFDFARKGDLSVFMPLAILRSLVRRAPFLLEMRNIPFAQQRQVLWHIIERLPRKRAGKMDATGNGMQLAEETVERWGAWIEAVMMTEPWYRENMPLLKAAFEDGTIELPRDRGVRDDYQALKLVRGVAACPIASAMPRRSKARARPSSATATRRSPARWRSRPATPSPRNMATNPCAATPPIGTNTAPGAVAPTPGKKITRRQRAA